MTSATGRPLDLLAARRWIDRTASAGADADADADSEREPEGVDGERAQTALDIASRLARRGLRPEALPWLDAAARAGNVRAAVAYGGTLVDVPGRFEEAERWLRRAADGGLPQGMLQLGRLLLYDGREAEADTWLAAALEADPLLIDQLAGELLLRGAEAVEDRWLRRTATAGSARAALLLGRLAEKRGQDDEAERWFEQAHALHDCEATFTLAERAGRRGDAAERQRRHEQAADGGYVMSQLALGVLFFDAGDYKRARLEFERAQTAGSTDALVPLVGLAALDGDAERALHWLRRVADHGDFENVRYYAKAFAATGRRDVAERVYTLAAGHDDGTAQVELGRLLLRRGEAAEAASWLRRPAAAEEPDAGLLLGIAELQRGDRRAARASFERAASAGDGRAAHKRGVMAFAEGDAAGTLAWYGRGAALGDTSSMYVLGTLHWLLEPQVARHWLTTAAERGHPHARQRLTETFGRA